MDRDAVNRPRATRRTSAGCLTLLLIIAVMLLLDRPVDTVLDTPFNPWAHSWRGEPTLVGTWVGMFSSPSGQPMALLLDLRRSRDSRGHFSSCVSCPRIEGAARLCASSAEQRYDVWGSPETWSGSTFHLRKLALTPQIAMLQLGYMRGTWTGEMLRLSMTLESGATEQAGDERDVSVPVEFTMERGDENDFLVNCRKLSAAGLLQ
jgi:hypothetical protein